MTPLLLLLLPCLPMSSGVASWYGHGFDGLQTASGLIYSESAMTCAHRTLPLGTVLDVWTDGKPARVRVTDRGPFVPGRDLDLSRGAFAALTHGDTERGLLPVRYRAVGRDTRGMLYGIGEDTT